jgi:hypothetical protein
MSSTTVNDAVPPPAIKAGRADEFDTLAPSPKALMRRRARSHLGLIIGSSLLAFVVLVAIFAPLLAPYDPYAQDLTRRLVDPVWAPKGSWENIFGTDALGRDVLSRLMYGARISLLIGFTAAVIAGIIGATLGILGGYFGGRVDSFIVYLINVKLALPVILIALSVSSISGGSGPLCRRHPQHDAADARARVHYVVAGGRRFPYAHYPARDFSQPAEPDHRHRQSRHGVDHPHRGGTVVPRPWRAPADAVLGPDGLGRARRHVLQALSDHDPGRGHLPAGDRDQYGGRWHTRRDVARRPWVSRWNIANTIPPMRLS